MPNSTRQHPDRSVPSNYCVLVKLFLRLRDGPRCRYCDTEFEIEKLTVDHTVPLMRGGQDDPDNVVLACRTCNSQKGPMTDLEYKEYGPMGGKFLILLDAGHYKPNPEWATWPKGQYARLTRKP
jgi:hypothetical protein